MKFYLDSSLSLWFVAVNSSNVNLIFIYLPRHTISHYEFRMVVMKGFAFKNALNCSRTPTHSMRSFVTIVCACLSLAHKSGQFSLYVPIWELLLCKQRWETEEKIQAQQISKIDRISLCTAAACSRYNIEGIIFFCSLVVMTVMRATPHEIQNSWADRANLRENIHFLYMLHCCSWQSMIVV